jgi:hypothetical protein
MVPVIINAVLNEHQLVIDIVSFVIRGDFHRSRLGEKQRGKILAGWVTRKMRTIAQYSIRDLHGFGLQEGQIAEEPQGRMSMSGASMTMRSMTGPASIKGGSMRASSLGVAAAMNNLHIQTGQYPPSISELPTQNYPESIPELGDETARGGDTPTGRDYVGHGSGTGYSPLDTTGVFDSPGGAGNQQHQPSFGSASSMPPAQVPNILRPGPREEAPYHHQSQTQPQYQSYQQESMQQQQYQPQSPEQQFDFDLTPQPEPTDNNTNRFSYEATHHDDGYGYGGGGGGGGGGLRVANASDAGLSSESEGDNEWRNDALMSMNFAGGDGPAGMGKL